MPIVHYVEYAYPGILFSETSAEKISSRKIKITLPPGAFAYRFYDRQEVTKNGERLSGSPKNETGWFYQGEAFTLEEVKRQFPQHNILIRNMETNNYKKVVKCSQGFVPLRHGDKVI